MRMWNRLVKAATTQCAHHVPPSPLAVAVRMVNMKWAYHDLTFGKDGHDDAGKSVQESDIDDADEYLPEFDYAIEGEEVHQLVATQVELRHARETLSQLCDKVVLFKREGKEAAEKEATQESKQAATVVAATLTKLRLARQRLAVRRTVREARHQRENRTGAWHEDKQDKPAEWQERHQLEGITGENNDVQGETHCVDVRRRRRAKGR